MSSKGMLQPGRLGDILILLPIAKKHYDSGTKLVWPIWESGAFFRKHVPYVDWRIIPDRTETKHEVKAFCPDVTDWLDPWFGWPSMEEQTRAWHRSGLPFDVYKYQLLGEDISLKYSLEIVRDRAAEEELFDAEACYSSYACSHSFSSVGYRDTSSAAYRETGKDVVEIFNRSPDPFDWLQVMEKADCLYLVDSFFLNLANQLNLPGNHVAYAKSKQTHDIEIPHLNSYWAPVRR